MSLNNSLDIYNYNMADGDNVAHITQAYGKKDLGVFFSPGLKVILTSLVTYIF